MRNEIRTFSGVSKSELEAKLSFKVAGTITSLNVSVGDTIESGQLIAELDPSTYQLQEQQAQADLTRATAELRNADSAYQRTRELYTKTRMHPRMTWIPRGRVLSLPRRRLVQPSVRWISPD